MTESRGNLEESAAEPRPYYAGEAFLVQPSMEQIVRPFGIARSLGLRVGNRAEAMLRSLKVRARVEVVACVAGIDALFE